MEPTSGPDPRAVFRDALADFARVWRPLAATDLVFKLIAVGILTPLVGFALRAGIALSGSGVIADVEILRFALRPAGLIVLLVAAALAVALVALEQACLMAIGAGAALGLEVPGGRALRWALRRAPDVVALALRLVGRTLLLAAPFLAALGAIYAFVLHEHDINYYLKEKPPAFLVAVALVVLVVAVLARVLVPRLVAWSLALPLVLFDEVAPRRALAESARRTEGTRLAVSKVVLRWAAAAALLSALVPAAIYAVGRQLVPFGRGNTGLVLALMLLLLVLWGVANFVISWASGSAFALLMVRLHLATGEGRERLEARLASAEALTSPGRPALSLGRVVAALAVAALAAGAVGLFLLRGVRGQNEIVVIAHRGASAEQPENTLAAVDAALDEHADFVEIDVQETADGELAIVHDSDFMRTSGVASKIWEASWREVSTIDVGSWFAPEFAAERVPTLREVLEHARGKAKVTIELKVYGHGVSLEHRVVELVESLGVADGVVLMSLDRPTVRNLKALRPDWTTGLLAATAVGDLTEIDADFFAVNSGLAKRALIRKAHAKGAKVYVWTVNDPVRMFQLANLGVDGLITDRPGLAKSVLERRARMSSAERLLVGLAFFFGASAPEPPPTPVND